MMHYNTKVWKINSIQTEGSSDDLDEAAQLLKAHETVAFPTETVYGLGADATCEQAVDKIFQAKGRPADNPLIVHVASKQKIEDLVTVIPPVAEKLIEQCMPGPLTIVLESNGSCAANVTAGLSTVAIRMPDHPVANALLKACDLPLAAPSANRSGRPSPTEAEHVYQDLNGRVSGIVDGGPTGVGVESTVVDCTSEVPIILRPGGLTKEEIESVVGEVMVDPALASDRDKPKSPGMKYKHYEPEAPLWLVNGSDDFFIQQLRELEQQGKRVGVIASTQFINKIEDANALSVGSRKDLKEVAVNLYKALRHFKKADVDVILCEAFPNEGVGEAIMNRLQKAASSQLDEF
ncbi:L-threonylcarbamoyladenylate synthase [Thalassobacillus hwangdonensis]|uniref:Threonylcarbamoyl-AMP synthase n=1 Tax=Thalassobacillus hwangdonensis TaxID=546108 RepID=A0ABW3L672_9BACI